jgi:hypothetical protein
MARHRLTSVVLALAELGVLEEGESREFSERVVELANSVHAADWAKGELEAAYAVAVESGTTAEVVSLRTRRKALETGHAAACTELRDLLQQIRRAIAVTSA